MANIAKLLSGIFVVLLLTYAAFYGRGMGERTINDLTARANQELVNHNLVGVTVAFEASPARRGAHLRGTLPPAQMAQAITTVRGVPGGGAPVWVRSEDRLDEKEVDGTCTTLGR